MHNERGNIFSNIQFFKAEELRHQAGITSPRMTHNQIHEALALLQQQEQTRIRELVFPEQDREVLFGDLYSPALTIAQSILDEVYNPLIDFVLTSADDETISPYITHAVYDYASGVAEPAQAVILAYDVLSSRYSHLKRKAETFDENREAVSVSLPQSITDAVEMSEQKEAIEYALLLTQDPSGQRLVSHILTRIKEDAVYHPKTSLTSKIVAYQEPQLVLAGARFSQGLFRALTIVETT